MIYAVAALIVVIALSVCLLAAMFASARRDEAWERMDKKAAAEKGRWK